jgi:hypothetical protein
MYILSYFGKNKLIILNLFSKKQKLYSDNKLNYIILINISSKFYNKIIIFYNIF